MSICKCEEPKEEIISKIVVGTMTNKYRVRCKICKCTKLVTNVIGGKK